MGDKNSKLICSEKDESSLGDTRSVFPLIYRSLVSSDGK